MEKECFAAKLRFIINKFFDKSLKESNLTKIEFEILNRIFVLNQRDISVKATMLSKDFQVSLPAILHKLEILEEKNFIVRSINKEDKRVKYYSLSSSAMEHYEKLHQAYMEMLEKYFDALGAEKEHLFKILDLTIQFLEVDK